MDQVKLDDIITGITATGLLCLLVILGLGELAANPYTYSGTPTPQPIHTNR